MNSNRKIGQLLLVEVNKQQLGIKNIVKVKDIKYLYVTGDIFNQLKPDIDDLIYMNNRASNLKTNLNNIEKVWKPIIICDDEIKSYDEDVLINRTIIHKLKGIDDFHGYDQGLDGNNYHLDKILVLPNQFSQEFLQAIVDQKIKSGDKVEVEIQDRFMMMSDILKEVDSWELKLRKDGSAILHPYTESVEEAAQKYCDWFENTPIQNRPKGMPIYNAFLAAVEWQKNQKK